MSTIDLSRISDKQYKFLSADKKHVGFGGARGGGKSWSVRTKAKILAATYNGIKVLIVRRTFPELVNNHINELIEELNGIARYNKTEKVFTFPNGSTIKFGYCNNDKDLLQYQGAEYDVIFLDEATQLQEMWIKKITACVRGVNDFPKRIYYTCNPGGASHGYFKRLFIDKVYEQGEDPADYDFIQALVTDNKALMESQPDYIKQLEALPPKLKEAWLYGRWDIFEGQFFEEFRTSPDLQKCHEAGITQEEALQQRRWTHVIEPFDLNKGEMRGWTIMRSYDFGYNKPFSLGYWAMDYDGVLYRIMEMYGCTQTPDEGVKWSPDEQFRRISEFEREHPWLKGRKIVDSVADPAIWDQSRGESIAETAAKYGIYFTPGDNNRIPGWMQVHYRMQFDENGYARMYVFNNCNAFIRTIPLMMYSDTKPEDLDTKLEDHCPDEVRYMCMSRPISPIIPVEKKTIISDPLNQFTDTQRTTRFI
jgi:phage terminase large subunit